MSNAAHIAWFLGMLAPRPLPPMPPLPPQVIAGDKSITDMITEGVQIPRFDPDVVARCGGYSKWAVVAKAGGRGYWLNLVDRNRSNPDEDCSGWMDWRASS